MVCLLNAALFGDWLVEQDQNLFLKYLDIQCFFYIRNLFLVNSIEICLYVCKWIVTFIQKLDFFCKLNIFLFRLEKNKRFRAVHLPLESIFSFVIYVKIIHQLIFKDVIIIYF